MGTNFYWLKRDDAEHDSDDPSNHIGKRSAAGLYCWDCRLTLCEGGEHAIHSGHGVMLGACPRCHQERKKAESFERGNPAGVELGFAPANVRPPTGVQGASSFSFAQQPDEVMARLDAGEAVVDEYGREYTAGGFRIMLDAQCPIRFVDTIGQWFS